MVATPCPPADAGSGTTKTSFLDIKYPRKGPDEPATGCPKRVTDGRRATFHINAISIDSQFFDTVKHHDRKSLIDLPIIDVSCFEAGTFQCPFAGRDRADPHDRRVNPCKTDGPYRSQWPDALFPRLLFAHQE